MRRGPVLLLAAPVLAFGINLVANEKPTAEFQALMRSTAAAAGPMGLRGHVPAKDYDAIAKDASTLKGNFTRIETFWSEKKVADAVTFAKNGYDAAEDLEKAAHAKDDPKIPPATITPRAHCTR